MRNAILIVLVITLVATVLGINSTARSARAFSAGEFLGVPNHHSNITRDALQSIPGFIIVSSYMDESDIADRQATTVSGAHYLNCAWDEGRSWIQGRRDAAVNYAYQYYLTGDITKRTYAIRSLGYVFHAAQDFYAHSNWIETHSWGQIANLKGSRPSGWYSATSSNKSPDRCTYGERHAHGLAWPVCWGLNKDTGACTGFSEARHDAVLATKDEWYRFEDAVRATVPDDAEDDVIRLMKGYPYEPPDPPPDDDPPDDEM